jgi:hypothetical protein
VKFEPATARAIATGRRSTLRIPAKPGKAGGCACGCGQPTPIAKRTRAALGHVKGQPTLYVAGHTAPRAERLDKLCRGCDQVLPLDAFYRSTRNGVQARCKSCADAYDSAKRNRARALAGPRQHHARKPDPERYCKQCEARMERKRFGERGLLETMARFERRLFCSPNCRRVWELKNCDEESTLHKRARKHRKDACEACGATAPLEVHHRDTNPANNHPSNLATLCQHCHQATHVALRRAKAKRARSRP